jgi:hypothetical protein
MRKGEEENTVFRFIMPSCVFYDASIGPAPRLVLIITNATPAPATDNAEQINIAVRNPDIKARSMKF